MNNVEDTIISQYRNTRTIYQLIKNTDEYIDPRADIDNFYNLVWNVETAQGFGLDIWGRIVNISRRIKISYNCFGFIESGSDTKSFNTETGTQNGGQFYRGVNLSSETMILDDESYRKLILTKALSNISIVNAPALNQILSNFFYGRGRCYVNDFGDMSMRYVFEFELSPVEISILLNSNCIVRPAGVLVYIFNCEIPAFGFNESGTCAMPFGHGTFYKQGLFYVEK